MQRLTIRLPGNIVLWSVCLVATLAPVLACAAVKSERIISGLNRPLYVTAAPGDASRLFIVGKGGLIKIYDRTSGSLLDTPFLDITSQISSVAELGLLGLSFHPDYDNNGQFYVNYSDTSGDTQVSRFEVSANANVANMASELPILSFEQTSRVHNGGWIDFSPNDGYLYISSGDSSDADNGQDANTLLGTMLRIDVDGDDFPGDPQANYAIPADNPFVSGGGAPEVWAYGLRNPWRNSFDRDNGDLYIGDVGAGTREEVNFQRADSTGGENYGWPLREGSIATPGSFGGDRPADNVDPVYDYLHGPEIFSGLSVIGGYVYRGPITPLRGQYFFGDFYGGHIWSISVDRDTQAMVEDSLTNWTSALEPDAHPIGNISSFGEDADGNLYIVDYGSGEVHLLTADPVPGDANGDFVVDGLDYLVWTTHFGDNPAQDPPGSPQNGDFNEDGKVDGLDYFFWTVNFGRGLNDAVAVPEPSGLALLVLAVVALAITRRR